MTFLVSTDLAARHLSSRPSNFLPPSFQDPPTFSTLRGGAVTTKHGPNSAVAAYNIYHKKIPHIAKFFIAGFIGNSLFYQIIKQMTPKIASIIPSMGEGNLSSAVFLVSYLIEIPFQHLINALFCYTLSSILQNPSSPLQTKKSRYFQTLGYTYAAYVNAMIVTTFIKRGLEEGGIGDPWAFVVSVYGVGVGNMFILNRAMK
ncbi:hypothetical protein TrLO_g687 [Triparma laevis f. longispina]|uniref:Uncharacterized protein n=1 Tax=Triparma laevis f. longispina TaxID=1714387 RepID=A0A9W7KZW4_9STRA|nr:hypothetical protein TrLO_g687 [Triparma laevis f. longispina]